MLQVRLPGPDALAGLIGASLHDAATRHRTRYLAAYELALESTRQPGSPGRWRGSARAPWAARSPSTASLGLPTTPEQAQALIALYNGTLMTLVVAPPGTVTPEVTLGLARCLVTGVLRPQEGH